MEQEKLLEMLWNSRKNELFFYSPYSFLRTVSSETLLENTVKQKLVKKIYVKELETVKITHDNEHFVFLLEYLPWDSSYFNIKTYRLHSVLFENSELYNLIQAVAKFIKSFLIKNSIYCIADIPSEDILVLQALNFNGFRLIETRMTYYLDLSKHNYERYSVRNATYDDIPNLRRVASEMRNPFDRFHADPVFSSLVADEFLATFVEASINGFADCTIVPNEIGTPPDAFVTAKYLKDEWPIIGEKVSKMVLSAVSAKTCKGWYKKLISEMAYLLRAEGADYAFMHPASTNKAVINTYETLGCKIGQVSHLLTFAPIERLVHD